MHHAATTSAPPHGAAIAVLPTVHMEPAAAFYRSLGFEVVAYDLDYSWVSHRSTRRASLRPIR